MTYDIKVGCDDNKPLIGDLSTRVLAFSKADLNYNGRLPLEAGKSQSLLSDHCCVTLNK